MKTHQQPTNTNNNNITINIDNSNTNILNWNRSYDDIPDEALLKTCKHHNNRLGDIPTTIEKFFRMAHKGDKSIQITNMRSNEAKVMEDGFYISTDTEHVTDDRLLQAVYRYQDIHDKGTNENFIDLFEKLEAALGENIDMDQRLRRCMRMCKTAIKRVFYDETRKVSA